MKKCGKYYFKMLNILTMLLLMFFLRIEVNTINLKQYTMRPRGEKILTCPCGPTLLCIFVEAAHRTKKSKGQLSWAVLGCLLGFYWIIDIHANYVPEDRQEPPTYPRAQPNMAQYKQPSKRFSSQHAAHHMAFYFLILVYFMY